MTLPFLTRRPAPVRRRIVDVTNHWRVQTTEEGRAMLRGVLVREPSGEVVTRYLPETHRALVRYYERAAA